MRVWCVVSILMLWMFAGSACRSPNWAPWGYVLEKGGASEITAWTLSQTEQVRIQDGASALATLFCGDDESEARMAMDGYVQVIKRLGIGWPGLMLHDWKKPPVLADNLPETERRPHLNRMLFAAYGSQAYAYYWSDYDSTHAPSAAERGHADLQH